MTEKRRCKRVKADLKLTVSSLFKQNNVKVEHVDSPITVTDISRSGIGFTSRGVFPEGFYFNAALKLGSEEDVLYCVVKIIRSQTTDTPDVYAYGCEFVGMPGILSYIFDEYEAGATEEA
jgi:hypothetical protein